MERDQDWAKYLKEGSTVQLMFHNGKVISVEPPNFVELQVTSCGPNVKGNTAAGGGLLCVRGPGGAEGGAALRGWVAGWLGGWVAGWLGASWGAVKQPPVYCQAARRAGV